MSRTDRALAVVGSIALLLGVGMMSASAVTELTDEQKLAILWTDFCARTGDERCLSPTPTATPAPTPTPTSVPTASPTPTTPAPTPTADTVTLESQAWWALGGFDIPSEVGHHIHVMATIPVGIVNGIVNIPVRLTLHDQVGTTSHLRVQEANGSGQTERFRQNITMGPCTDCTVDLVIPMDFSKWATGRSEMRFSLNVPDEQPNVSGSQRMFQSTGWQVCVRSCSPSYRSGEFHEARGWYDNGPQGVEHGYQNARLTTALSSVKSGGTIGVSLKPGASGRATRGAGVYIDPNFHHGDSGIVVREWTGPFTGSVTLPTLPSGAHRLVLVAHDGQNAGVLLIPFVVP